MLPDWQLPPGTDRGLWDYLRNDAMARSYDEKLAGTPLLQTDLDFAARHFDKPGRLIDLGCGTGRLLLHFARLWEPAAQARVEQSPLRALRAPKEIDFLGVDLSDAMLEVVAEKAKREQVTIPLLKANLVELDAIASASFDYAACLFSTLGMIRGLENRRKFLGHVARILRPGGVFVLHVHNRRFRFGRGLGKKGKDKGDRTMPQAYGGAELTLHHFSYGEIREELKLAGFTFRACQAVSTDGELRHAWWLPAVGAYGYLIAATVM